MDVIGYELKEEELFAYVFRINIDGCLEHGKHHFLFTMNIMNCVLKKLAFDENIVRYNVEDKRSLDVNAFLKVIEFFIYFKKKEKFEILKDS